MVASALFGSNFTVLRINVIFARGCGLVSCHFGFDADGRPVSSNHKEDARKNWWAGILLGIFGEEFITSDVGGDLGARLVAFSYLCGIGKGRVGRAVTLYWALGLPFLAKALDLIIEIIFY